MELQDIDGSRAYYSNYGSALDFVAPGGDNRVDQNGDGNGILQNTFNTATKDSTDFSYQFFQGTSMATPHVSGITALLIAEGANGPDEVRAVIQKRQPIWALQAGTNITDTDS
ncbi:TPA: S8 family serine peptidase [Methanosarcina acetivorans]|uniref:S8 family serine peptidase n=1 Tax=Methanosarcina acetivorans TaxID=2214 RepID=A0A832SHV3_9EURY|nr:S8 family serine peptidase [Methanosarcina acetivorans]HIH93538.1 S8 family serine peptidase [Methanosarcina acetivorans]